MFDEPSLCDRLFIPLLVIAVFGVMLGFRAYVNHARADKAAPIGGTRVLHLEAIEHVYECERDGERVLTDRPCQTGVPIKIVKTREAGD